MIWPPPPLRIDLVIEKKRENNELVFIVKDPLNSESYEFGQEELFLLHSMGSYHDPAELMSKFKSRFSLDMSEVQLIDFIEMVGQWGLLSSNPEKERSNQTILPLNGETYPIAAQNNLIDVEVDDPIAPSPEVHVGPAPANSFQNKRVNGSKEKSVKMVQWVWFNPARLFGFLAHALSFLRYLAYIPIVLFFVAGFTIFNNLQIFVSDFASYQTALSLFEHLIFSMFTVNLITVLGHGIVCKSAGADVTQFGIRFILNLVPRFGIGITGTKELPRSSKLWIHGSPLLIRLTLLGIAAIVWFSARANGTQLSEFALMLATVSFFSFVFAANPLTKGNGYDLLATLIEIPNLRQKANRAFFGWLSGKSKSTDDEETQFALKAFAMASFIYVVAIIGIITVVSAQWLELNYQGTGVAIFLSLFFYLAYQFRKNIIVKRNRMLAKKDKLYAGLEQKMGGRGLQKLRQHAAGRAGLTIDHQTDVKKRGYLKYIVIAALIPVMFIPYPYETGGSIQVLPVERQEIYAGTTGIIKNVYFKGGELVKKGQLLGELSALEESKNISTTKTSILEQQAKLNELLSTPRPEDVNQAKQRLETSRTEAKFSAEAAERMSRLFTDGNVSLEMFEEAKRKMEVDKTEVLEAEANLAKVKSGPHPQEIEAAQHELQRLNEQLVYYEEELKLTKFIAPIDGHLITRNLDFLVGKYLNKGDLFATIENSKIAKVEIQIPQSDAVDVKMGAKTRLKVWTYPQQIFEGKVVEISPVVEENDTGEVVVITTYASNEDGLLQSGMTGFGKIDGGEKPVIVAFTRMFVLFFMVEIWSWLP